MTRPHIKGDIHVRIRTGAASAALAGLLAVAATAPAQADDREPTQPPSSTYSNGHGPGLAAGGGVGAFVTEGDRVHFSHTVHGNINAHGWWKRLNGPAKKAKVTVWLQVKNNGHWYTLNKGVKTVYSGGGSGKRASAAWKCTNLIAKYSFRSVIDVDIIGYPDDAHKKITDTQTLFCGT
ncbi:hypothetical protein [Streptomyces sp. NPDC059649]|uniref:hypothetical protein n=1 Tax=Streptomyces sp. NPDC059649 TaxID=3346895 RepID=UPI0036CF5596